MASKYVNSGWYAPLMYTSFAFLILFVQLLPLSRGYAGLPFPDLLFCLTMAWVIRQPENLPLGLIVILFLLADFLLLRPPGLWTALVVIAVEFMKSRIIKSREISWVVEWFTTSTVMVAAILLNRALLTMFVVSTPPFSLEALLMLFNVLVYPLVILFVRFGLGLERSNKGDTSAQKVI